jgi:hypothetical protein
MRSYSIDTTSSSDLTAFYISGCDIAVSALFRMTEIRTKIFGRNFPASAAITDPALPNRRS